MNENYLSAETRGGLRTSCAARPGRLGQVAARNALFLLGATLILLGCRVVYPLPDWPLLFGFGLLIMAWAFRLQLAASD